MLELTRKIDKFFSTSFRKKFTVIISLPLIIGTLYLVDFYFLPNIEKEDNIAEVYRVSAKHSSIVRSNRVDIKVGYRYITDNNYSFTTSKNYINYKRVKLKISPIFKTVKKVTSNDNFIQIVSGLKGVKGYIYMIWYLAIIISLLYMYMSKEVTENAKLNLIYFNIFLLMILLWTLFKLG